jgi:hypothetical protein
VRKTQIVWNTHAVAQSASPVSAGVFVTGETICVVCRRSGGAQAITWI